MNGQPVDAATALWLGLVQGATEFLPVSSSGHVALGAALFGERELPLSFVILLHAGTFLATVLVLRSEVWSALGASAKLLSAPREAAASPGGAEVIAVLLATLPTAVVGFAMKEAVEDYSHDLRVVAICFLASAVLVTSTRFIEGKKEVLDSRRALLVGLAQGLSVLPGLSRSGTTIAVGMMLGLRPSAAFRFSFLLSLPAIAGAVIGEALFDGSFLAFAPTDLMAALVAAVVGYACLVLLRGMLDRGHFWSFALYLVPLGLYLLIWEPAR